MENFSEGFFVLAVLVITFVNWLSDRLKRRHAKKKGLPVEEEDPDKYIFFEQEDASQSPDPVAAEPEPSRKVRQDPNEEIRKFFEAISGQAPLAEAPQAEQTPELAPPVTRSRASRDLDTPPPIPAAATKPRELSKEEKEALERFERDVDAGGIARRNKNRSVKVDALRKILRDRDSVRTAILVNEILGTPKGIQASTSH